MTTAEFISNNFGIASKRDRHCSSVWADHSGNIYSYGRHYPLLFKVGNLVFRNTRGYSNTTAKHINWAYDPEAIDVELSGCNQYTWNNPENVNKIPAILSHVRYYSVNDASNYKWQDRALHAILADLREQRGAITKELNSKKRTDTAIYRQLQDKLQKVNDSITKVERG